MTNRPQGKDVTEHVFSPGRVSQLTSALVQERKDSDETGVLSGIVDLDRVMIPMRAGELVGIVGRTSNYKSFLMDYICLYNAQQIAPEDGEIVIKGTWEQSIEEDTLPKLAAMSGISINKMARGQVSDEEWVSVQQAAVSRASLPIWMIGHSTLVSREKRRVRPALTIEEFIQAIEYIADQATGSKFKIRLISVDYLQRINIGSKDEHMRGRYMEIVDRCKDIAGSMGCPVMLGCQGKRELDDKKWKLPGLGDGQETSNFEQSSDKYISLWYPWKSEQPGSNLVVNGETFTVDENLLILGLLKQKLGGAPYVIPIRVTPQTNKIDSYYHGIRR